MDTVLLVGVLSDPLWTAMTVAGRRGPLSDAVATALWSLLASRRSRLRTFVDIEAWSWGDVECLDTADRRVTRR